MTDLRAHVSPIATQRELGWMHPEDDCHGSWIAATWIAATAAWALETGREGITTPQFPPAP